MKPSCSFCTESEISVLEITELMVRQCATPQILSLLCRYAGQPDERTQIAFFLIKDQTWTLAANGALNRRSEATLARIDPACVSDALFRDAAPFRDGLKTGEHAGYRLDGGWARHLHSGPGELLGMIVGLCDGPPLPSAPGAVRIELVCRLAALAIEQANLIAELALNQAQNVLPDAPALAWDSEVQQVTQMIAQQCAPEEILEVLCAHAGDLEGAHQVAFFLTRDGMWTLAAKGSLTPQSEAALALIDPERLSAEIFESNADPAGRNESPFEGGWARHLCSGTGELLGLMVCPCGRPTLPRSVHAARIESACRLAVLAVEQSNLIGELAFKADHDSLTGLPNRACHERLLRSTLQENGRTGTPAALLYINLDRFRLVNDVIGLATGNLLLEEVGRRLRACLPPGPSLARMGGDEFAVLIPDIAAPKDAGAVAARLLDSLSTSFSIDGHELFIGASIGIGCSTPDSTPESLEREAYLALYEAKRAGKARAVFFHSSMAAVPPERLEMEKRLRFALAQGEFAVHYQPQVEFATGRVSGVEALLRWRPETLGLVSPAAFIPILEETGLIVDVGRWVLRESCRQGREWLDTAGLRLRIGVNFSAVQLLHPDFNRHVEEALAETGFPPELLELELTESLFIGEFAPASRILGKLQTMGIGLALDDFGTGQSSLSYLHRLPFHRLKIDQSFIRGIGDGEECPPIVRNIIQMAGSLGMGTIAEGVETAHQAELLRLQECGEGQGFFFSRGRPPNEVAEFCRGHQGEFAGAGAADFSPAHQLAE
jgi:diguanylate cyclase (GGDEF)-like protein